jgi:ferrous iron transport protein A
MTLDTGRIGGAYRLCAMSLPLSLEKRLQALGLITGTRIEVLNNKSHGTLIIKVRGTRFAIGRNISRHLTVEEVAHES